MVQHPLLGRGLIIVEASRPHTTLGRTQPNAKTTQNTHKEQTSMPLAGFGSTAPESERL